MPDLTFQSRINWADDEEDDFDIDVWKANADLSAPTVDSLPPLQIPDTQDNSAFTVYERESPAETLPWANCKESNTVSYHKLPTYIGSGHEAVAFHATSNRHSRPPHIELSCYEDGTISPHARINYSTNWKKKKVELGWDGRETALLRKSKMRDVETAEVELTLRELEAPNLCTIDEDSCLSSDIYDTPNLVLCKDEGYYSDITPPKSPILCVSKEEFKIPCCATRVGISPASTFTMRHPCTKSQDAGVDTVNDGPLDAIDPVPMDDAKLGITGSLAKGWTQISSMNWTTTAVVATGVLAGAGLYFARRR